MHLISLCVLAYAVLLALVAGPSVAKPALRLLNDLDMDLAIISQTRPLTPVRQETLVLLVAYYC